jgi:iron complex outermembrane receptor protein
MMGNAVGTPDLKNTVNYEFDLGVEKQYENASIKTKVFYSKLNDYIAYNASNTTTMMDKQVSLNAYENVDATLYGIELSGTFVATDALYFDYGVAYQRGTKDHALSGQTGTNLPDIAPMKLNAAVNYAYDDSMALRAELVAADSWDEIDAENGEQKLDAYAVLNLKGTKTFGDNFEVTVGIDNVFDKTYAASNTYKDLILLPTLGDNEVMLLNEPGRYVYTNIKYTF